MLFLKCFSILHKRNGYFLYLFAVAPHAGAWIEMVISSASWPKAWVAPHAGAWIEITIARLRDVKVWCRSPRGSVD